MGVNFIREFKRTLPPEGFMILPFPSPSCIHTSPTGLQRLQRINISIMPIISSFKIS